MTPETKFTMCIKHNHEHEEVKLMQQYWRQRKDLYQKHCDELFALRQNAAAPAVAKFYNMLLEHAYCAFKNAESHWVLIRVYNCSWHLISSQPNTYQITKAIQQATKPNPNKKTILDHLNSAQSAVQKVSFLGGMVVSITQAIESIQRIM